MTAEGMTAGGAMKRVGLISDTHGKLRPQVFTLFADVDAIIHAGDIGGVDILTELRTIAPVYAVHGNTDGFDIRDIAPESVLVELAGRRIIVAHGHLLGSPTPANLRAAFPECDVIVYGHTHKPLIDESRLPLVVNPGAAGAARFNLKPSVGLLDLETLRVRILSIDG